MRRAAGGLAPDGASAAGVLAPVEASSAAAVAAVRTARGVAGSAEALLASLPAPVAVVGNAASREAWGAIIDRYPTVLRINNFQIAGFEPLVGRRTDVWCTSGWDDIAPRAARAVLSPFRADAPESAHLAAFRARQGGNVATPMADVKALAPVLSKPSTGAAVALLLDALGIDADLFLFDGFQSGHYWAPGEATGTTHSSVEWSLLTSRPHLAVHGGRATPWPSSRALGDPRRALDALASDGLIAAHPRLLIVGRTDAAYLDALRAGGAEVTAVESAYALASHESPCDACVLTDLQDRLPTHETRVVLRHARRLAPSLGLDATRHAARVAWRHGPPGGATACGVPAGYVERLAPSYYIDHDGGTVWQPDVYRLVRDLGRHAGCRRAIDVGCGQGRKLATLHPEFDLVGLDYGANLDHCRAGHGWGRWIEADLELDGPPPVPPSELAGSIVVSADVIEHLRTPGGLLARLRRMLDAAPVAVLTTPERTLTHGDAHHGPPPNPAHVREWSLPELRAYVEAAGLRVAFAGLTASESDTYARQTSVLVLAGATLDETARRRLGERTGQLLELYDRERGTRGARTATAATVGVAPAAPPTHRPALAVPRQPPTSDVAEQVSIVMRTKDRPQLLERALTSVRAQSWPHWQAVVVNDAGDRRAVEEVVQAILPEDARVTLVHRETAAGMEAATNAGVAVATGRYLTLLDDDDTWEPTFLDTCVRHLRTRTAGTVRGVVTHSTRIDEEIVGAGVIERARVPFTPALTRVTLAELTERNLFPVNAFVYDRDALEVVGPYRADLPVLGDWEFNLRFVRHYDVDVLPTALANYHQRPAAAAGTYANSPIGLHRAYDARVRNALLRADLDAGVPGLGVLANLRPLLSEASHQLAEVRQRLEAVAGDRETWRAQAERLQAELEVVQAARRRDWLTAYEPRARALAARLRRRAAGTVVVIGAGDGAALVADACAAAGIRVAALGDNDASRWTQPWRHLRVQPVDDAVAVAADAIVIASVAHGRSLTAQATRALADCGQRRPVLGLA